MGGFSPAWFIGIAIGLVGLTEVMFPESWRPAVRRISLPTSVVLFLIGIVGAGADFKDAYQFDSPVKKWSLQWPVRKRIEVRSPQVRLVEEWRHDDKGTTAPYSQFMISYTLDKQPTLSPIDTFLRVALVNVGSSPIQIEDWFLETSNSPDGPWESLDVIPFQPFDVYGISDPSHKRAVKLQFPYFAEEVKQPLSPKKSATGFVLCECSFAPQNIYHGPNSGVLYSTCVHFYLRLTLRLNTGGTVSAVASLASGENIPDIAMHVDAGFHDISTARILRPYPPALYWAVPTNGEPQAFDVSGK